MNAEKLNINQLIERCRRRDKSAQIQLYRQYYKAMYNTAFRILRDEFEAEDLMQEAFLTAFNKLNTFRGEVAFGAWLKRIVINKSLTQLKKNNRYSEVKMEVVSDDAIDTGMNLNHELLGVENILKTINGLKDNYRIILNLNLIEGYDYEEIATILNYSNVNVRTTISRAKKKLQQMLLSENPKVSMYGR
ncbi:RNA polymerase subunit sigma [Tenacibaculum sp. SZ-18]|uniref:RNA polymerase sigma factor n=1 Tax=Tenacibaculum sp. SZ-18 TaxID=754423 RepID=UPI000C2D05C0|nr:RNA polymerase sigma factor [Tenacibaculum sp. SZ-18]AUC15061.1 RNA polymerase subunit sigma [Tenacibaculum sp. SZ-18]